LTTPPSEKKRFLLSSKQITRSEVVELIRKEHPELADRLPTTAEPSFQFTAPFDLSLTESVLGLKEYIPWQETVLKSLDEGLKVEKRLFKTA
jgi:hypothetical protein